MPTTVYPSRAGGFPPASFLTFADALEYVRFFYSRLGYLLARYQQLCDECRARGRAVNYGNPSSLAAGIPSAWFGQWTPNAADQALNIDRINQRGGLRA